MIRFGNVLNKPGINIEEVNGVVNIDRFGHLGNVLLVPLLGEYGVTVVP